MAAVDEYDDAAEGPALVTGASGHVGNNLVRRLLAGGAQVRALCRDHTPALAGLEVEAVYGDIRDTGAIEAAVRGCARVFHCALPCQAEGRRELHDTLVLGTRNLAQAALRSGVGRVVVASSIAAAGRDRGDPRLPITEELPFDPFERRAPAAIALAQAEAECWRAAASGLHLVIAAAGIAVGPHDYKPSPVGRLLLAHARGRPIGLGAGGFEFVGVVDLADGLIAAARRGKRGGKYILSSEYLTADGLVERIELATGGPRARRSLPSRLVAAAAALARARVGRTPPLPEAIVRALRLRMRADTSRARSELGFRPARVQDAIADAHEHFLTRGLLGEARARAGFAPA